MARKKINAICPYCNGAVTYPAEGVEMVRTKRKDTFYFHTACFIRRRKEYNRWTFQQ